MLQRAPGLRILLRSNNEIVVELNGEEVRAGSRGLAILDVFGQPLSFRDAMKRLSRTLSGVTDWQEVVTTIFVLFEGGVLTAATDESVREITPKGYGGARIHIGMLNDRPRTDAFLRALREMVTPGDVVLDIGTGTGVLAIGAAQAGARHVYAIESSAARLLAEPVIAANGFQDRVSLVPGWSTQVSIPEPADLFVSEMIGDEPLAERILEITLDARARLMKPGARQIPRTIEIWMVPVSVPPEEIQMRQFTSEIQQDWNAWYGIDFSPLSEPVQRRSPIFFVDPWTARDWPMPAAAVQMSRTDLCTFTDPTISATVRVPARQAGQITGLMTFFETELSPGNFLSTHPRKAPPNNHWVNKVQILASPLTVEVGDLVELSYEYRNGTIRNGIQIAMTESVPT